MRVFKSLNEKGFLEVGVRRFLVVMGLGAVALSGSSGVAQEAVAARALDMTTPEEEGAGSMSFTVEEGARLHEAPRVIGSMMFALGAEQLYISMDTADVFALRPKTVWVPLDKGPKTRADEASGTLIVGAKTYAAVEGGMWITPLAGEQFPPVYEVSFDMTFVPFEEADSYKLAEVARDEAKVRRQGKVRVENATVSCTDASRAQRVWVVPVDLLKSKLNEEPLPFCHAVLTGRR